METNITASRDNISINIITERQAKCIGHVLRRNRLLRDITEGKISGKTASVKSRQKTFDWMTDKENRKRKKGQWREKWREWCAEPAL